MQAAGAAVGVGLFGAGVGVGWAGTGVGTGATSPLSRPRYLAASSAYAPLSTTPVSALSRTRRNESAPLGMAMAYNCGSMPSPTSLTPPCCTYVWAGWLSSSTRSIRLFFRSLTACSISGYEYRLLAGICLVSTSVSCMKVSYTEPLCTPTRCVANCSGWVIDVMADCAFASTAPTPA